MHRSVRHSTVRHRNKISVVESKMGNRTTCEKTAVRSGREREKENGRKNAENEWPRSGDRDATKSKIVPVAAIRRKLMRAGLQMAGGAKETKFSARMWRCGPSMKNPTNEDLAEVLTGLEGPGAMEEQGQASQAGGATIAEESGKVAPGWRMPEEVAGDVLAIDDGAAAASCGGAEPQILDATVLSEPAATVPPGAVLATSTSVTNELPLSGVGVGVGGEGAEEEGGWAAGDAVGGSEMAAEG